VRFNRLYTKFLLSFLAVLTVTEIVVLIVFVAIPAHRFSTRLERYSANTARTVRGIVEEKMRAEPNVPLSENGPLRTFVVDFARVIHGRVWLTDARGASVLTSFPGPVPPFVRGMGENSLHGYAGFRVSTRPHFGHYYAVLPLEVSGAWVGDIHVIIDEGSIPPARGRFVSGFLILGIVIAVSIIPVSRLITGRLDRLRRSAIRIAEGDLSHRAYVGGGDEISELARAFNGMTDRMESMIMSGKELTANVSHEVRSPLARIRLSEEMLRERLSQTDALGWPDHLDAIREEIDELDGIVGRTLELSKLDTQAASLNLEDLDPGALLAEVAGKFAHGIERKGVRFALEPVYKPPFRGDGEVLKATFVNVLDNAVKFVPRGGAISASMDWRPTDLSIHIVNTFDRMSDEDLSHIFDPFRRVGRATRGGYGLGLTIARKAIERHGGRMLAKNGEGGFEIEMILPRNT
jgi:signal transduction histidine kinase